MGWLIRLYVMGFSNEKTADLLDSNVSGGAGHGKIENKFQLSFPPALNFQRVGKLQQRLSEFQNQSLISKVQSRQNIYCTCNRIVTKNNFYRHGSSKEVGGFSVAEI